MPNYSKEMARLQAHMRASRQLYDWIAGAQALALLNTALETGIL